MLLRPTCESAKQLKHLASHRTGTSSCADLASMRTLGKPKGTAQFVDQQRRCLRKKLCCSLMLYSCDDCIKQSADNAEASRAMYSDLPSEATDVSVRRSAGTMVLKQKQRPETSSCAGHSLQQDSWSRGSAVASKGKLLLMVYWRPSGTSCREWNLQQQTPGAHRDVLGSK